MAPKRKFKTLAARPSSGRKERRTKVRFDRSSRSPSPFSAPSPPSSPPRATPSNPPPAASPLRATPPNPQPHSATRASGSSPPSRVIPFLSRPVTTGRNINFSFLEQEGFLIGEFLKIQGWEFLCSQNLKTYPNLVREFYGNAKISSISFTTTVKGVRISLSESLLGNIFRAPPLGAMRLPDRQSGLNLLFGRSDILSFEQISTKFLSVELRLLHHMVARILLPRVGRFDFLTSNDIAIMFHLIRKEPFNLPALALRVMQEAAQRSKPALPYGMLLTLLFEEFHVSLDNEPSISLHHYDTYDRRSLARMKFKKVNGHWTKEGEELGETSVPASRQETAPEPSLPEPPAASPPAAPASSIRLDEDQLDEIAEKVVRRLASFLPPLVTAAVREALAPQRQSPDPEPVPPPSPTAADDVD